MSLTPAFTHALQVEVATLQAQFPDLADGLPRAHALVSSGAVFDEESGHEAMVRANDEQHWYHVNGHCHCKASEFRSEPCKYRLISACTRK